MKDRRSQDLRDEREREYGILVAELAGELLKARTERDDFAEVLARRPTALHIDMYHYLESRWDIPTHERRWLLKILIQVLEREIDGDETGAAAVSKLLRHKSRVARTDFALRRLSFLIPRKQRPDVFGDLLEDCRELRAEGASEWRVRFHILWHLIGSAPGWLKMLVGALASRLVGS